MAILILDGKTALFGAKEGISICLQTVIPALFPFFVLSGWLMGMAGGSRLLRPLGRLCRIPEGAEAVLIPAFLGGYPMGAACVGTACRRGWLDRREGARLLAFCSNAGPAFLFGMLGPMFPRGWMVWSLWGIHVLGAILTAAVLPGGGGRAALPDTPPSDGIMKGAVSAMASVCGWVIFFRVVLAFLDRWVLWLLPLWAQVLGTGLLELINGCLRLGYLESLSERYVFCSAFLAMGGLCVALQTASVAGGLPMRSYFLGKALQTGFSLLFSTGVVLGFWPVLLAISGLFLLISPGIRKNSGKISEVGV